VSPGDDAGRREAAPFTTTHWSVVLKAQGDSPAAQEALEKLCRIYWRPIYSFVRRQRVGPEEAEDLTQGFFALLLERKDLNTVRKEKGRLRSYLIVSLKNFLADESRHAMAIKRGKGQRLIPLEELGVDERIQMEPADLMTAEQIYEHRWASAVLEHVLNRLKDEYRAAGHAGRTWRALAGGRCCAIRHDRECGQAGVSPISTALPIVIARGNCPHSCYA
jgi:RNA polymerase sigma factor (sigma-70 family)